MTAREKKAVEIAVNKCSKTQGMLDNHIIDAVRDAILEAMQWQAERCAEASLYSLTGYEYLRGKITMDKNVTLNAGTEEMK